MKSTHSLFAVAVAGLSLLGGLASAAVPTLINYQGLLTDNSGNPVADDTYEVTFRIYDQTSSERWVETHNITTSDGLFTVELGSNGSPLMPSVFDYTECWLGITITGDQEMTPRTRLVSVPYAQRVATVDGASGGDITSKVSIGPGHTNTGENAFVAGASNEVSDATAVVSGGTGNVASAASTTISGGALNTASASQATVGGGLSNEASGDKATVGGGEGNVADFSRATVAGGSSNSASGIAASVGGGESNSAIGVKSTVSGGADNIAGTDGATVGGGGTNRARGYYSTVSGGGGPYEADSNVALGDWSVVGGGYANVAAGEVATIAGGYNNHTSDIGATIGGGYSNIASGYFSFVGGGQDNYARGPNSVICGGGRASMVVSDSNLASGTLATIVGGRRHIAAGTASTILGGYANVTTGDEAVAMGKHAKAHHDAAVVIAANSSGSLSDSVYSGGNEQLVIRADGGIYITNTSGEATYDNTNIITTRGGAFLSGNGDDWTNSSDRNKKENFKAVDAQGILRRLVQLKITQWNYKGDSDNISHIGPVAQDFYALFGLGSDDRTISTVDPAGIALVAIQGLYTTTQELGRKTSEIDALKERVEHLSSLVQNLLVRQDETDDTASFSVAVNE